VRTLGFAWLAVGLSSCIQSAPIVEGSSNFDDGDIDWDVDTLPDAGRRDAGRPRVDAGPRGFPFDGGLLPPFEHDAGFLVPPPARLSSLITHERTLPALSGGTLAVRGAGDVAVAADSDRDRIYVVSLTGNARQQIDLEVGSEPGRVIIDELGRAHVALRGAGQVLTLDLASARVIARSPLCSLPRGLAYDAAQDALVVACAGGELVTVAAGTHQPIASAQLELDLRDVVLDADGTRLVSRYRSAELLRVTAAGALLSKSQPAPTSVLLGKIPELTPGTKFDQSSSDTVSSSPTLAWRTVSGDHGRVLMLHQQSRDSEIDLGEGNTGGGYGGGCSTITTGAVTVFGTNGTVGPSIQLAPHGLTVDIAMSPDGRSIALAEPGGYLRALPTVEVVDIGAFTNSLVVDPSIVDAGAFVPPSCITGWQAGTDYQGTAVAYDDGGKLYVFSREPAALKVYVANEPHIGGIPVPTREIVLALESVRDTGHDLFHADVGSGMSCAGCHGEGLDDGHVWNFKGFGPRRTQTMRGGLLSTLPLHWEGDLPTFKHLVDEVMTRRMGGFQVEQQFGDALAQWLDKLPPLKLGRSHDDAVARGKALFESAEVACASCHSGPHLTNNQSVDVGTGEALQVPTLQGIALHAPFMHDGCADTLEQRFEPACGGGDAHGHTSQLSAAQIADLVSYLKTL
jgi:mono/diheme cytochrome c family protein